MESIESRWTDPTPLRLGSAADTQSNPIQSNHLGTFHVRRICAKQCMCLCQSRFVIGQLARCRCCTLGKNPLVHVSNVFCLVGVVGRIQVWQNKRRRPTAAASALCSTQHFHSHVRVETHSFDEHDCLFFVLEFDNGIICARRIVEERRSVVDAFGEFHASALPTAEGAPADSKDCHVLGQRRSSVGGGEWLNRPPGSAGVQSVARTSRGKTNDMSHAPNLASIEQNNACGLQAFHGIGHFC
jgi:hypothetical protein